MLDERPVKVALVHDWLTGMRGGENVLEMLCECYPDAELFTLLHLPGSVSPAIERLTIHTSALQRLPGIRHYYRECLPLFPTLIERFDGGPVGLSTLAVALGEEPDTIEDVYEPYLLQLGFLQRTPRGRVITKLGRAHIGALAADERLF